MSAPDFYVIAHRGASAYCPENTAAAFQRALECGCRQFETDVRLTADGVPVLCHDSDLKRYGYPGKRVEEMLSCEFAQLDLGSWFDKQPCPGLSLEELVCSFGTSITYHVEIKGASDAIELKTCEVLASRGLLPSTIFTSFNWRSLEILHNLSPELHLGWLVHDLKESTVAQAKALPLFQICPPAEEVTPQLAASLRDFFPEVCCWKLPVELDAAQQEIDRLYQSGCSCLTCNFPELWPAAAKQNEC